VRRRGSPSSPRRSRSEPQVKLALPSGGGPLGQSHGPPDCWSGKGRRCRSMRRGFMRETGEGGSDQTADRLCRGGGDAEAHHGAAGRQSHRPRLTSGECPPASQQTLGPDPRRRPDDDPRAGVRVRAAGGPEEVLTLDMVAAVFGLPCVTLPDPVTGRPMMLPIGRHRLPGSDETGQVSPTG